MGNILAYSGIVTKIRAMEAKLLTPAQFEEIANLGNVLEVVSYLKEHSAYAEVLSALDDDKLHRGNIEKVLVQSLYHDYSKIYRFCGQTQRRFLKLYLKRYEIDLINYCLRIVINHYRQPFDLLYKKNFFDHYSQISIEKLITSRTTDELIENLKDTEYYAPLKKIQESQHISLFDYELTLNLYYFSTLWKERKKVLKNPELAATPTAAMTKPYFDQAQGLDDVTKMQYVDIHTWMLFDILLKADKMSMANSLELRVPFLDKKMLDIALQLPSKYRVTKESTKLALRKAAIQQLPPKTANKKKLGFPVPLNDWLKQDKYYQQVKTMFQSEDAKKFFNQEYILQLLEDHKSGKKGNMKKVWSVYCFLLWYNEFFVKR